MGQFLVEKPALPGSALSGNQQAQAWVPPAIVLDLFSLRS